jgi:hypothetical protein
VRSVLCSTTTAADALHVRERSLCQQYQGSTQGGVHSVLRSPRTATAAFAPTTAATATTHTSDATATTAAPNARAGTVPASGHGLHQVDSHYQSTKLPARVRGAAIDDGLPALQ